MTAPVTLTIKLTETGLTPAGPSVPVLNAFTGILAGVSSETISSYYDTTDAAYGTGTLLAQTTFSAPGANSMNFPGTIIASALYSESEIITATFAPSGSDTLSSNAHTTAAVVPEPLSMGLLGSGLLCVGVLRWRRRKS